MSPEPDGPSLLFLLLALLCLLLSALYAACESALDRLSFSRVKKDAEGGSKTARLLLSILQAQAALISPLQLGLVFFGLCGLACTLTAFLPDAAALLSGLSSAPLRMLCALLLVLLPYLLLFFTFADLLPRKLSRRDSDFARRHAGLLRFLTALSRPALSLCGAISNGVLRLLRMDPHALTDAVTEEEILEMVGAGEEKGVIEETERDMISNILDFNDTTVGEIMTHRTDIVAVPDTAPLSQVVEASLENGCSRIPVYHEDVDSVVGICYVKDLLPYVGSPIPDLIRVTGVMRPVYLVPETKKCSQLFREMTERKVQIAVVVDEYGGTAGLITLEDLVESIVGNIQDEFDHEEEEFYRVSETEFTVDGSASIDEVSDLVDTELPEGDYDTVAGLVMERLGRIPEENEHPSVRVEDLTFTVLEVEDQRLSRLLIVKEREQEPEDS